MIDLPSETLEFFDNDELRARIFYEKYSLSDLEGNRTEKTPVEMWKRISKELASVENEKERKEIEEKFYWLLEDFKFVPGGRILFGAGSNHKATLLNCYYIPIKKDSLEGIYDTAKEMARTYSYGGGVGIDLSVLRPRGAAVNNAARFSTGSTSFMELYSVTTGIIGQTGRRGALMITLDVTHPDIEDFVTIKSDKKSVRYANISVKVYDDFMEAVENDKPFTLHFKNDKVEFKKEIKAKELWRKIIDTAVNTGDPGIMFWDRMKKESPTEYDDRTAIKGTNPCLLGNTFLQTEYGLTPIAKLATKTEFALADTSDKTKAKKVWLTGVKKVYKFKTALGLYLDATANHNVMCRRGPDINPSEKMIIDSLSEEEYTSVKALQRSTGLSLTTLYRYVTALADKSLLDVRKDAVSGTILKLSPNARTLSNFGWEEIGRLKEGDKLLVSVKEGVFPSRYLELPEFPQLDTVKGHRRNVFKFPKFINENIGGLLGWILTDGVSVSHKRASSRLLDAERFIGIISINSDEDKDISGLIRNVFGTEPKGGKTRKNKAVKDWLVHGQNLAGFIDYFGLNKYHSEIEVPPQILASPKSVVASFIKRAFEGDGSCVYDRVTIDSISGKFIVEMQQLLLKFGILSSVHTSKRAKPRKDIHVLNITDLKSLKEFKKSIGFVSADKNSSVDRLINRMEKMKGEGNTQFSSKYRWIDGKHVETALTDISFIGELPVYDCETESHSFIANGFVVHNCSEQPLENYGACDLGAINLDYFVKNQFTKDANVDWENLEKTIRYGVRFLDNVLDYSYNRHALKEQAEETVYARRIGLGIMGLANMLISMNLKYDSDRAVEFVDYLMKRIKETAYDESSDLAREKGSFPAFVAEKHVQRDFVKRLDKSIIDKIKTQGLRNACILTVAPTGSISSMAGVSGGIEPIFALSYTRRSESLSEEKFEVLDPFVNRYMKKFGIKGKNELPEVFVTAHRIDPFFRVKMQSTIQKHIDSSISSTVNLSADTDADTVDKIYRYAWKLGCKSITVYREGSKDDILKATDEKPAEKQEEVMIEEDRPFMLSGTTIRMPTSQGNMYLTVNKDESGKIKEVFIDMGRSGETEKSFTEALGRLISIYLQSGGDVNRVIRTLKGIKGGNSLWFNGIQIFSIPDGIAKAIELTVKNRNPDRENETLHGVLKNNDNLENEKATVCPECHQKTLIFENGCFICKNCGYTKCE
jgi:ribonucleoside-diphosphate reductase alpha chain